MGSLAVVALVVGLGLVSCSSGSDSSPTTTSTTTTAADTGQDQAEPATSPAEAVTALLAAEQGGDHEASYRLLSAAGRKALDPGAWARLRNQLPAITAVRIDEGPDDGTVVAVVDHEPGLDPFLGLTPARERQTWKASEQGGGWVVEPEPVIEPEFPDVALAQDAALAWARAVQSCDEKAAKTHEGVAALFGPVEAAAGLCGSQATVATGAPEALLGGPDSQALVAQYGPEALVWAKAVPVMGADRPFSVVLAPIGSVWKVVAVFAS